MMEKFFGQGAKRPDRGSTERVSGTPTFSEEQKARLAGLGYEHFYTLTRQSIASLRNAGNRFWSEWHKDHTLEQIASMGTEVALNPRALFIAGSNRKNLTDQLAMIGKFSKALGKEVPGVEAVMGEASDYSALAFAHERATGKRLFGSDYNYDYARTKTPTSGSPVAVVGSFHDDGLDVTHLDRGSGHGHVWAVPLVVPKGAR